MKKLYRILRSQRGDLLIDSMFSVVLITLIMTSAAGVLMVAATSSHGSGVNTGRTVLLNTTLSDAKPGIATYSATPVTVTATDQGGDITVTLWREDKTATLQILHAATSRSGSQPSDCTDPASMDPNKCLQSETAVATSQAGVAVTPVALNPGTGGALFDLTAPATATELRYVIKVTGASADSVLTFANQDHPEVTLAVPVPSGQTGYYYGRVLVNAGSHLALTTTGPVTIDSTATMIYEEPV